VIKSQDPDVRSCLHAHLPPPRPGLRQQQDVYSDVAFPRGHVELQRRARRRGRRPSLLSQPSRVAHLICSWDDLFLHGPTTTSRDYIRSCDFPSYSPRHEHHTARTRAYPKPRSDALQESLQDAACHDEILHKEKRGKRKRKQEKVMGGGGRKGEDDDGKRGKWDGA
jgi:hypothetical protein